MTILGYQLKQIRKAIAGAAAGAAAGVVPLFAAAITDLHINLGEVGGMAAAAVLGAAAGFGAVFKVENAPATPRKPTKRRAPARRRKPADPAPLQD